MGKLFTGYMVTNCQGHPYQWDLGVLWDSEPRQPPAIFKDRASAMVAIVKSLEYGVRNLKEWRCDDYRIQGVRNV